MYKGLLKIKSDYFVSHDKMYKRELYDTEKKGTTLQGTALEPMSYELICADSDLRI